MCLWKDPVEYTQCMSLYIDAVYVFKQSMYLQKYPVEKFEYIYMYTYIYIDIYGYIYICTCIYIYYTYIYNMYICIHWRSRYGHTRLHVHTVSTCISESTRSTSLNIYTYSIKVTPRNLNTDVWILSQYQVHNSTWSRSLNKRLLNGNDNSSQYTYICVCSRLKYVWILYDIYVWIYFKNTRSRSLNKRSLNGIDKSSLTGIVLCRIICGKA